MSSHRGGRRPASPVSDPRRSDTSPGLGRRGSRLPLVVAWGATLLIVGYPAGVSAFSAAPAATVEALDDGGDYRWAPEAVTVAAGQSVRWTYTEATAPHQLSASRMRVRRASLERAVAAVSSAAWHGAAALRRKSAEAHGLHHRRPWTTFD